MTGRLLSWHFLITFLALGFFTAPQAHAGDNQTLTYQGVLTDSSDVPYTSTQTVAFSIYSPAPGSCLLFSETQSVTPDSKGRFSAVIGTGTRTDSTGIAFNKIFVNNGTFSGLTCASGTAYSPNATDDRSLVISVNGTELSPFVAIKAVAFALQAQELNGWGVNDIVKVHPTIGSPTTFTSTEMARAKTITGANCATNEILKWNGSDWACATDDTGGAAPGDAGYTGSKGLVAFDTDAATSGITVTSGVAKLSSTGVTVGTYGSAAAVPTFSVNSQGRLISASSVGISLPPSQLTQSSAITGDVLKWNGTGWTPAPDATGGSPGDASYSVKGLVQANTDATTSGLNLAAGVISVNFGTGANQIVKLDASAKLPAVNGSALTGLSVSQISSGTLSIAQGGTGAGTKTAAFDALSPLTTKGDVIVFDGTNNIRLPAGSNGQVLTADSAQTSGVKWAAVGSGSVTSVTAGTGLSGGTITSTGTISVNAGTGANQIVQLDASSKLPAVDGSALTGLSATQISAGTLPVSRGGTGASSFAANNLIGTNGTGSALQAVTCTQNQLISFDASGNYGCYALSTLASGTYFAKGGNSFGSNVALGTSDAFALSFQTNGSVAQMIDQNGNVGIGTGAAALSNRLVVRSASSDTSAPVQVRNINSAGFSAIDFVDSGGTQRVGIGFGNPTAALLNGLAYFGTPGADPVILRTNGAERIRITSAGDVGIGTSTPSVALDVNGTIAVKSSYEGASSYAAAASSYVIPDTSLNIRRITLNGNATITLPSFTGVSGKMYSLTVFLKQDATGSRTATFAGSAGDTVKWDSGTAPTISSTANKITILQFIKPSDETVWYGSMVWKEN